MKRSRRGYLLVETMVVIALVGVVTSLITAALISMLLTDRNLRAAYEHQRVLQQLEVQLRDDASQATAVKVEGPVCRFTLGTSHVWLWRVEGTMLQREVWEENELVERDRYELRDDTVCQWLPDEAPSPQWLQLRVSREVNSQRPQSERPQQPRETALPLVAWRLRLRTVPAAPAASQGGNS